MTEQEFRDRLLEINNSSKFGSVGRNFPKALLRLQEGYEDDFSYYSGHEQFFFGGNDWNGALDEEDAKLVCEAGIMPDEENGMGFFIFT